MLFAEIQREGFTGSYASLWRLVSHSLSTDASIEPTKPPEPAALRLSATQAAWLLVRKHEKLSEKQKALQQTLLNISSIANQAYPLAQAFRQFINERQADALDPWLQQAQASGIAELCRFAGSLQSDYQAVKNALLFAWSNGQVEGQVNRLKLIKRTMYGRAGFDLLRRKALWGT